MDQTSEHFSEPTPETPQNLTVTAEIKNYLSETARWGKFLGILGFIGVGVMILFSVFLGLFMNRLPGMPAQNGNPMANMGGVVMPIYMLLISLLYFFPSLYLYKFGTKTRTALNNNNTTDLAIAFSKLKSFFKFMGILTIVAIGFYLLAIIGFGVFAIFMKQNNAGV